MEPKFKGRRILIVEDEALVALDIADSFKRAGAEVMTTNSLKRALIIADRADLSAAVVDHALIDGDSAPIRERLEERGIPFVICSGIVGQDDIVCDAPVINKPATLDILTSTVDGLLARNLKLG
jgi:DNA-binding response OmpR family regulator